jgi:hypothetical protein
MRASAFVKIDIIDAAPADDQPASCERQALEWAKCQNGKWRGKFPRSIHRTNGLYRRPGRLLRSGAYGQRVQALREKSELSGSQVRSRHRRCIS